MTPTSRAAEIWPELRRGLAQLQHSLAPTEFVPAEAERTFHISASPYFGEILMPSVVARVRSQAPHIRLHVHSPGPGLAEALEIGRLDLAVGVYGRIAEAFQRETLFEESLVWVLRADHPAGHDAMTLKDLETLKVVLLSPGSGDRDSADRVNRKIEPMVLWDDLASDQAPLGRNARERIEVVVDNAHAALAIVSNSDMAALAPRRLALSRREALGLRVVELPVGRRAAFEAVWRADQTSHPAMTWLRQILRDASSEA